MRRSFVYPLKVWMTSVLVSPLLYLLIIKMGGYRDQYAALFSGWGYYAVAVMVGALFSIPNWLLLWVCYYFISRTKLTYLTKKAALLTIGLLLTALLFVLFNGGKEIIHSADYITAVSYMLTVTIGSLVYKVNLSSV